MFLKSISLWTAGFSAQAQKITVLSAGGYVLTSGPKNLCASFSFSAASATAKSISIGTRYSYETVNSTHNIQSDIDADCEFRETNAREDRTGEVILTRTNDEICKGNRVSRTLSTATIHPTEVQVRHEIEGAPAYTCIWKKQEAK
jgi:hypothetical protein